MALEADAPLYIVHMNAAGEADKLKYAREHGVKVMGETCPQYLFFTIEHLRRPDGAKWVCSPPMRAEADNARLWEGLADGRTVLSRPLAATIARSSSTARSQLSMKGGKWLFRAKSWARTISPKSPTACPAWATACQSCGLMACGLAK